ncbi:MAG: phage holin [Bacilli bacterium]|nr:phage holin [Bacilli bacterium]
MKMSNETYDILKKISLIMVPLATFVSVLAKLWGFEQGTIIAGTISAFGVFLGSALAISSQEYHKEDENKSE